MKITIVSFLAYAGLFLLLSACQQEIKPTISIETNLPFNLLDYHGTPNSPNYRNSLAFSDQGAWFAYGIPEHPDQFGGFSGPFLMTQDNGIWCSSSLSRLVLFDSKTGAELPWVDFKSNTKAYNSHLEQVFENNQLKVKQILFFSSSHKALQITELTNISEEPVSIRPRWNGHLLSGNIHLKGMDHITALISDNSEATGYIYYPQNELSRLLVTDSSIIAELNKITLRPGHSHYLHLAHVFTFPEDHQNKELGTLDNISTRWNELLKNRINEKQNQLNTLEENISKDYNEPIYHDLLAKCVLTLQNNWRIPAGELKHSGLFPSYHYIWFHGFWAWDSWKHSVALAQYHPQLAKDQIRAMIDFMDEDGFIADCVYRDTTIENHNYRNTKPPLLGWAVWKLFEQDPDTAFLQELYPSIIRQHEWWYSNRDHDQDEICEYGSTDGTLIAAKWESGMDNAVRFDNSQILQNSETAYSLNQESVDLNAYLYAEKKYLSRIATVLQDSIFAHRFAKEADFLAVNIQNQFYDPLSGWFYDTNLEGDQFIHSMGCEGWIPLWANVAFPDQAEAVKENMMNSEYFNTHMPLQTLSATNPLFKPDGGYWRGPNWIDQAYFGIQGLKNYGYISEANRLTTKLINNAEGLLSKGPSIRENYQPLTGAGLESQNFSWSAAHFLMLMMDE